MDLAGFPRGGVINKKVFSHPVDEMYIFFKRNCSSFLYSKVKVVPSIKSQVLINLRNVRMDTFVPVE